MQVTNADVRVRAVHARVLCHLNQLDWDYATIDCLARRATDLTVV
jgi:hypothetical protein